MNRVTSIAALAAFLLTATACTADPATDGTGEAGTTAAPATTAAAAETTTPADVPTAIVSLAPALTEMLFAIGAGDQVIAVDNFSDYPAEAAAKPNDLSGYEPNVEAIAALSPDLVVMSEDTVKDQLEALGIPVWIGPAATTFDDVYTQIEQLGAATGHIAEAAEVVAQMQSSIADAVDAASAALEGIDLASLTYYHELDPTLYSLTSNTFAGQVYSLFGLTNIADGAQEGNDYPQLNPEYIVAANPSLIFLADTKCCGESPETVAARDGWSDLDAVVSGRVIAIDDDIASRWGPRIVDFVIAVRDALLAVAASV